MKYSETFLFVKLVAITAAIFVSAVVTGNAEAKQGGSGTPTFLNFSGVKPPASKNQAIQSLLYDQDRLLAGHLLRRAGFGPAPKDLKKLTKKGAAGRLKWIQDQLVPTSINDDKAEAKLPDISSGLLRLRLHSPLVYADGSFQEAASGENDAHLARTFFSLQ